MLASWVTLFLDLWGLRWTRRRIGTAGALVVARYRGWQLFGIQSKFYYYYDIIRDEIVLPLEEFGFDAA